MNKKEYEQERNKREVLVLHPDCPIPPILKIYMVIGQNVFVYKCVNLEYNTLFIHYKYILP